MNIKLTYEEAQQIILNFYKLNPSDKVVIGRKKKKLSTTNTIAQAIIDEIKSLDYTGDDKITAIKRFRELYYCSLYEAKWSIENFDEIVNFTKINNRMPRFDSRGIGIPKLY